MCLMKSDFLANLNLRLRVNLSPSLNPGRRYLHSLFEERHLKLLLCQKFLQKTQSMHGKRKALEDVIRPKTAESQTPRPHIIESSSPEELAASCVCASGQRSR